MAKINYKELSTENLKKLKLNYNLLAVLGVIIALSGLTIFELADNEKYRFVFYGSLFIGGIMSSLRTRAIKSKKELKLREDNQVTKKPQPDD